MSIKIKLKKGVKISKLVVYEQEPVYLDVEVIVVPPGEYLNDQYHEWQKMAKNANTYL